MTEPEHRVCSSCISRAASTALVTESIACAPRSSELTRVAGCVDRHSWHWDVHVLINLPHLRIGRKGQRGRCARAPARLRRERLRKSLLGAPARSRRNPQRLRRSTFNGAASASRSLVATAASCSLSKAHNISHTVVACALVCLTQSRKCTSSSRRCALHAQRCFRVAHAESLTRVCCASADPRRQSEHVRRRREGAQLGSAASWSGTTGTCCRLGAPHESRLYSLTRQSLALALYRRTRLHRKCRATASSLARS